MKLHTYYNVHMLLSLGYEWQLHIVGQVSHQKQSAHVKDWLVGIIWAKMETSFCVGGGAMVCRN